MIERVTMSIQQWNEWKDKFDAMEDALSFYANEDNYKSLVDWPYPTILADEGDKARKVIGIPNE